MTIRSSRIMPWVIAIAPTLVVLTAQSAFAGVTNIGQLDTAKTTLTTFVTGLASFACIFLLGVLIWDFVQHRNIGRSIFEFLGVVMLGVIAINAGTVATAFQGAGASL